MFVFGTPMASDVVIYMCKKLREIFSFGEDMDVQRLVISARGKRKMIYPERTSPSHRCDLTQVCIDDSQT